MPHLNPHQVCTISGILKHAVENLVVTLNLRPLYLTGLPSGPEPRPDPIPDARHDTYVFQMVGLLYVLDAKSSEYDHSHFAIFLSVVLGHGIFFALKMCFPLNQVFGVGYRAPLARNVLNVTDSAVATPETSDFPQRTFHGCST